MSDKEFINGISAKAPHERAADFVKARVAIKLSDFAKYLRELKGREPDVEWLNFDVKVNRVGKWYVERDTWKPQQQADSAPAESERFDDDIPF